VRDRARLGDHPVAETRWTETNHFVSGCETTLTVCDPPYDAGKLKAESRPSEAVLDRLIRQQAECEHDVAEVEPGCLYLDLHLTGCERAPGVCLPTQVAQLPRELEAERNRRRVNCQRLAQLWNGLDSQTGDIAFAARTKDYFAFVVRLVELAFEQLGGEVGSERAGQIDHAHCAVHDLVTHRSSETP
jgi:hypothetical protein